LTIVPPEDIDAVAARPPVASSTLRDAKVWSFRI
jgi:hypothetical protein